MKRKILNQVLGASMLLLVGQSGSGLQAQNCCSTLTSCMGSGYEYGMNPPVNFAGVCECTWVGHIDYIYWKPFEDCLEWTTESRIFDIQNPANFSNAADNKLINFDWDSGFSLGLGYGFPCDKWTLSVDWTHYRTDTKRDLTASSVATDLVGPSSEFVSFSIPFVNVPFPLTQAEGLKQVGYAGKWRLQYNQVDLTFSRRYFAGPCMMLNPYAGLSVLTMKQDMDACINSDYIVETSNDVELARFFGRYKSEFKGVGIIAGLDTNFEICSGLGVYGEWGMGAYYGTFDTGHKALFNTIQADGDVEANVRYRSGKSFEALRITNHLGLGLAWMSRFNCERNMFTFKAGWEHNAYFGQNMFPELNVAIERDANLSYVNQVTYSKGDLYLYGFRFSFEVGF